MIERHGTERGGNGGAASRPLANAKPLGASHTDLSHASRYVLIVDDDDSVRETLAELLEDEGYHAIQASNAAEAMAALKMRAMDVLVTDLSMPGDDGAALIRHAKRAQPGLPAILLTGYAESAAAVSMVAGVECHVLRKPVEAGQLLTQIALLLKTH